jgi:hypothetical protein
MTTTTATAVDQLPECSSNVEEIQFDCSRTWEFRCATDGRLYSFHFNCPAYARRYMMGQYVDEVARDRNRAQSLSERKQRTLLANAAEREQRHAGILAYWLANPLHCTCG